MLSYKILKSFHIISIICWMAGLLYLPRLFVYHTRAKENPFMNDTFKIMESKLLKIIMFPSLISSIITGALLMHIRSTTISTLLIIKLILVSLLIIFHLWTLKTQRTFKKDANSRSELFFRAINEIPSIIMIAIIFVVVFKAN